MIIFHGIYFHLLFLRLKIYNYVDLFWFCDSIPGVGLRQLHRLPALHPPKANHQVLPGGSGRRGQVRDSGAQTAPADARHGEEQVPRAQELPLSQRTHQIHQ
jgi:hypothetical protein